MSDASTGLRDPDSPNLDDLDWVNRLADLMDERFDSVQIFVSKRDIKTKAATQHFSIGRGNHYARIGQVREYLIKEDELSRMECHEEES